jgi:hypothetical protein
MSEKATLIIESDIKPGTTIAVQWKNLRREGLQHVRHKGAKRDLITFFNATAK